MKIEKPKKVLGFDPEKCNKIYEELVTIFQKYKPTIGEVLISYGNLGYTLGASIDGYKDKGPSLEELSKLYYSNPTIGISLMLSGLTTTSWYEEYSNQKIKEKLGE